MPVSAACRVRDPHSRNERMTIVSGVTNVSPGDRSSGFPVTFFVRYVAKNLHVIAQNTQSYVETTEKKGLCGLFSGGLFLA
jgi:hypothetical protein